MLSVEGLYKHATIMSDQAWTEVESPTESTLHDVISRGDDTYACGSDGLILHREKEDGWTAIVENGPTNNGNSLYALGLTDDGERLWCVGSSGIVAEYDIERDQLTNHTIGDFQNTYTDLAVTGEAGDANLYVVDGSGQVHYSFDNADSWNFALPGSGSELKGIDFYDKQKGFTVNADGDVFHTSDGTQWTDSLKETGVTLYGVICECTPDTNPDDNLELEHVRSDGSLRGVYVCGDGSVFRYDGNDWDLDNLCGTSLHDTSVPEDEEVLTVGGGGLIYRYDEEWTEESSPTDETYHGVCRGEVEVAVGSSGTIVEREPVADTGSVGTEATDEG